MITKVESGDSGGRLRDSGGNACRKYSVVEGGQRHFTRPPFNGKYLPRQKQG